MKNNVTELVFILDRSGSMSGFESDTIGGFNSMLEKQKQNDEKCFITTVLFDNKSEMLHDRKNIKSVKNMTEKDYIVRGCTALYDAVGSMIEHIEMIHKYSRPEDVPENTIFIITTDGMENASRAYNGSQIKEMISKKQQQGWEFVFLAANIDAEETATSIGIAQDHAVNYCQDAAGVKATYETMNAAITDVRASKKLSNCSWRKKLDDDNKRRK